MNFYQSETVVFGESFASTILAALKTVPGAALIASGKLRLSTDAAFNPTPTSVITNFTANEANFSGYTAGGNAVVLTAPVNLSTTCDGVLFTTLFLAVTASPFVPNVVYGYWIDDGTNVIMGERFAAGATCGISEPGDFLNLTAVVPLQLQQATS